MVARPILPSKAKFQIEPILKMERHNIFLCGKKLELSWAQRNVLTVVGLPQPIKQTYSVINKIGNTCNNDQLLTFCNLNTSFAGLFYIIGTG